MKISVPSLLALAAFAASAVTAQAAPDLKIAVVDMSSLYEHHWQTQAEMTKMKADQASASAQFDQMTKDINAQYAQYKELADQAKDPMTTADAKAKAESDAQKLGAQIQQKLNDRNQFGQQVQQEFQQRVQSFHEMLIDEISQKAVEIAKSPRRDPPPRQVRDRNARDQGHPLCGSVLRHHRRGRRGDRQGPSGLGPRGLGPDGSLDPGRPRGPVVRQRTPADHRPGRDRPGAVTGPSPSGPASPRSGAFLFP